MDRYLLRYKYGYSRIAAGLPVGEVLVGDAAQVKAFLCLCETEATAPGYTQQVNGQHPCVQTARGGHYPSRRLRRYADGTLEPDRDSAGLDLAEGGVSSMDRHTMVTLVQGDLRLLAEVTWPGGRYDEHPRIDYRDPVTCAEIDPRAVSDEAMQKLLTDHLHDAAFVSQAWGYASLTLRWNGIAWAPNGGTRWRGGGAPMSDEIAVCCGGMDEGSDQWPPESGERYELWLDLTDEPPEDFKPGYWVVLRDDKGHQAEGWIGYFSPSDDEDFDSYCNVLGADPRLLDLQHVSTLYMRLGRLRHADQ